MTVRPIRDTTPEGSLAARLARDVAESFLPFAGGAAGLLCAGAALPADALPAAARPALVALLVLVCLAGWFRLFTARARGRLRRPLAEGRMLAGAEAALAATRAALSRREAEQAATHAELARARAAAHRAAGGRSEFLSAMSHELRTPLNGVLGMAGLLASERLPGEAGEWADAALQAARDLARQLDGVFDWVALQDRSLVVEARTFPLADVRAVLERDVAARVEARGLGFRVRFGAGLPRLVRGDRRRLLRILEHLVENACKFTAAGEVRVEVRRGTGEDVVFEVRDTGTGFDRRALARLFQPFSPADASSTRRFDGAGLGLALAQRIAGVMHGRVEVDAAVRGGACVRLVLRLDAVVEGDVGPRLEGPEGPSDELGDGGATAPSRSGRRILVVDDNPVNRRLVAAVLRRAGHEPLLARDGLEAVESFRAERPDLVLMDCFMPGLDGLGATRRIRELELRRAGGQVPIVALTAGGRETEAACRAAGMDGFLEKPVEPGELTRVVAAHLRRARRGAA